MAERILPCRECGEPLPDLDGFGVDYCPHCNWCEHRHFHWERHPDDPRVWICTACGETMRRSDA